MQKKYNEQGKFLYTSTYTSLNFHSKAAFFQQNVFFCEFVSMFLMEIRFLENNEKFLYANNIYDATSKK